MFCNNFAFSKKQQMSNNYFKFKKFTIIQDGCAMKVGTDGCLLGSWFDCSQSKRILDIGCGSGLIAIMAAQRSCAHITGVEIDKKAAEQAMENVNNSPWRERIEIVNADMLDYTSDNKFDTIVSNPPYFVNSLKCDDSSRTMARHSDSLGSREFFSKCAEISTTTVVIAIVIPCDIMKEWQSSAIEHGFYTKRIAYVRTTPKKAPKRVLIEFVRTVVDTPEEKTLILENSPGEYSEEAKEILRDFYLKIE